MRRIRILWLLPVLALLILSCEDVLTMAMNKAQFITQPTNQDMVTDFQAQQGKDNREVILTWNNPIAGDFSSVLLLRRTGSAPQSYDDEDAEVLYTGRYERYTDSLLEKDNTYYYAIYGKNTAGQYSPPALASKEVTEDDEDIRKRSFFIIGGSSDYSDPEGNLVTSVEMFDPLKEEIYPDITTLPGNRGRAFCDVASVGNKIYIFGGYDASGVVEATVDVLNIENLSWSIASSMPSPRCALRTVMWNDKIYCLGGSTTNTSGGVLSSNYIYDPVTDEHTNDANIFKDFGTARCAFRAVAYNGMIYYFGGKNSGGARQNSGESINIISNQSTSLGGLSYYFGGTTAFFNKSFDNGDEVAIFFTIGGCTTGTSNTALPYGSTIAFANNYLYAAFLPNATGGVPAGYRIDYQEVENYTNRMYAECEYYGDYIYYFGGITADSNASNLIERFDVKGGILMESEWTQLTGVTLDEARYGFGITRINQ